ncbi:sterigmatocystin 8-O-methyltransferase [Achaetomium macrosporum]|uniref:Sterigmatocystin 8-O-methyltransferase n=1 Tax=Achaetomium macrosporum TaxID=79813 RepID=A0AAN7HBY0_9PEZI|nr:sterigmatocystin 8-O-methyltransferase [Achaetomium macrosporum]
MASHDGSRAFDRELPLETLSWKITKHAAVVSQYLAAHELPQPSAERDGPVTVVPDNAPAHVRQSLEQLAAASLEMTQLALGPSEYVANLATGLQYISCLSWLCQYEILRRVPLDGAISYADLAAVAGVPEQRLKSVVRMAMTSGLFRERPGIGVAHSATSALLARNADTHAWASYLCARTAPMALAMGAAHKRWGPDTVRPNETAYNLAFNTDLPFFDDIARDEARVSEFAAYMRNVRSSKGIAIEHLLNGYKWQSIREGGLVVDVGGSTGTTAIMLARKFPHLRFVVEDLEANAESGRKALPAELASRVTFKAHDFMQPQPVRGADVYLLRMILHDWPDDASIHILRHLVAAMAERPGARLIIMDTVLPAPGSVPLSVERIVRIRDLTMMQAFNSKERDLDDWKNLLAAADARLRLVNVVQPFGSDMSVLEVQLDPGATSNGVVA